MSIVVMIISNNKSMKKFSQRLKELRLAKGISQKELATILNTTNSSICDWECERSEPSIEVLLCLAKYFDVTCDYLLGASDYL